MTDEIKNILDYLKRSDKNKFGFEQGKLIDYEETQLLLDYITNLQQDLEKANDIIEKDRQFYKCRMDEYAELKKENERLKEIIKDNTILVKDENGNYQECNINPLDYKSRFEKTIKDIGLLMTGNYEVCGTIYMQSSCCNKRLEIIKKDLIGSDENE